MTPSQIFNHYPHIWPFSRALSDYHTSDPRPLEQQITSSKDSHSTENLKIDSIFVYNDPRDWGLDLAVIIDCLLSRQGYLGTESAKNGDFDLPNRGYQSDGQPPLYFSNPDLWFAADWNLPRLGQGGFKAALEGVWTEITGTELKSHVMGKPFQATYEYAEKKLDSHRAVFADGKTLPPLKDVYMVGDNPGKIPPISCFIAGMANFDTQLRTSEGPWASRAPMERHGARHLSGLASMLAGSQRSIPLSSWTMSPRR